MQVSEDSEAVSRRTETAYKAQSPGELAQHNEASDSGDRVNAAPGVSRWSLTCIAKVYVLIRGDLFGVRPFGSARYGNIPVDRAEVSRGHSRRGSRHDGMAIGNEPRPTMWRTSWRSYPTEGPNTKNSSTHHEL